MGGRLVFRLREWLRRPFGDRRGAAPGGARVYRRLSLGARIRRWVGRLFYGFIALSLASVALFAFVNPPTTLLMVGERFQHGAIEQRWTPLEDISPALRLAALAAEDARFCEHRGFDVEALRKAVADWRAGGRLIGASTISQQTAKNVFLWPARSFVRKGLEFWFTALIEIFWSKKRILEVYLNVAEFGPGVFGVEAAAQRSFGASASTLGVNRSARLATVLPAPQRLNPADLPEDRLARVKAIVDGARTLDGDGRAACVLP